MNRNAPHYHGVFNQGVAIVKLPAQIISGIHAAVASFLLLFVPTAVGWSQSVMQWISAGHHTPLPDTSTLGIAALSALAAASIGFVLSTYRYLQMRFPWLPGAFPTFTPQPPK